MEAAGEERSPGLEAQVEAAGRRGRRGADRATSTETTDPRRTRGYGRKAVEIVKTVKILEMYFKMRH